MRGEQNNQSYVFSYVSPEQRVPANHPLRNIKEYADAALKAMSQRFDEMYSHTGRPSIPPETLMKSQLLIALYSVRSDRLFCEMLDYNLMFRWFLDMDMEQDSFDASVFSKNRERLMDHEIAHQFLQAVVNLARAANLLSDEHFTADGTLIEAWASLKSFVKKDGAGAKRSDDDPGNPNVDFHGEKRSNATHQSTTDPDARLFRKSNGTAAKLAYCGTVLMENRNGLCIDIAVAPARKTAESAATVQMIDTEYKRGKHKIKTLGTDKGFCNRSFVQALRQKDIIPHVAKIEKWHIPGLDRRTIRHATYEISQRIRKRVEEIFGWCKSIGGLRKTRLKGTDRNQEQACVIVAAYDLLRMSKLLMAT